MSDRMDPQVISERIQSAIANHASFVIRYWQQSGTRTVYGEQMSEVLPHAIVFYELNGSFSISGLIEESVVDAIWTEFDDCPNCEERVIDLDTWDTGGDEPWCYLCVREGWETGHADLLTSDGGLI